MRIRFVEQESTLGLAHAVGALESRVQLPFLLMLGDIYFHLKAPLRPLCEQVLSGDVNANLVSMYEPIPRWSAATSSFRRTSAGACTA